MRRFSRKVDECKPLGAGGQEGEAGGGGGQRGRRAGGVAGGLRRQQRRRGLPNTAPEYSTSYAVLVGGSNGDGAWRGLVSIVELIDRRPYMFQVTVCGNLIYTVIYMSDRLLTQANPNSRLPPPPDMRSQGVSFKLRNGDSIRA